MQAKLQGQKRLQRDISKLRRKGYLIEQLNENSTEFVVSLAGPQETAYAGFTYKVRVFIGEQYPLKSPSIGFATKIFHPNIDFQLA